MQFIDFFKDILTAYPIAAQFNKDTNTYSLDLRLLNHRIKNNDLEQFLADLEQDLELPISEKKLKFDFLGGDQSEFKKNVFTNFILLQISATQFYQAFHSFYKMIPVKELFSYLYIDVYGAESIPRRSSYEPYIIALLNQDFTHQPIGHTDFLDILNFNIFIHEINYLKIKDGLKSFLKTHINQVTAHLIDSNALISVAQTNDIKYFQNELRNKIGKFIKTEDLDEFNEFWPKILIKPSDEDMVSDVDRAIVIDLNYGYLSKTYFKMPTETICMAVASYILDFIYCNLSDHLSCRLYTQNTKSSRFSIILHKNIEKKNIPEIFSLIINIMLETKIIENGSLLSQYSDAHESLVEHIQKELEIISLKNILPEKNETRPNIKI